MSPSTTTISVMLTNSNVACALGYAPRGWIVHPLHHVKPSGEYFYNRNNNLQAHKKGKCSRSSSCYLVLTTVQAQIMRQRVRIGVGLSAIWRILGGVL